MLPVSAYYTEQMLVDTNREISVNGVSGRMSLQFLKHIFKQNRTFAGTKIEVLGFCLLKAEFGPLATVWVTMLYPEAIVDGKQREIRIYNKE
jgi:hypothetical protein